MNEIKCNCPGCGAKYRLPLECAGRRAKCKRCGDPFEVPKAERGLDDSIVAWLTEGEEHDEEVTTAPRVISMKDDHVAADESGRAKGIIRRASDTKAPK